MKRLFCAGILGAGLSLLVTGLVQGQVQNENVRSLENAVRTDDDRDNDDFDPGLLGLVGLLGLGGLLGLNRNRDEVRGMKFTPAERPGVAPIDQPRRQS